MALEKTPWRVCDARINAVLSGAHLQVSHLQIDIRQEARNVFLGVLKGKWQEDRRTVQSWLAEPRIGQDTHLAIQMLIQGWRGTELTGPCVRVIHMPNMNGIKEYPATSTFQVRAMHDFLVSLSSNRDSVIKAMQTFQRNHHLVDVLQSLQALQPAMERERVFTEEASNPQHPLLPPHMDPAQALINRVKRARK